MGKIYCITGNENQTYEVLQHIKSSIMKWADTDGHIEINDRPENEEYDLYINNYIIVSDFNDINTLKDDFGEDNVIAIYIGNSDEDQTDLIEKEIYKVYDIMDYQECLEEIVQVEFNDYKQINYKFESFEEKKQLEFEAGMVTDIQEEVTDKPEDIKKTTIKGFILNNKKFAISLIAIIVCIVIAFSSVLYIYAVQDAPYICKEDYLLVETGSEDMYVINTYGDVFSFKGYTQCTLIKSLDRKSALVLTNYNELYLLTRGNSVKIAENIRYSEISNYGEYIYYITSNDETAVLNRYDIKKEKRVELDSFESLYFDVSNIVISPDGKKAVISIVNSYTDAYSNHVYFYDKNGDKEDISSFGTPIGISDKNVIYVLDALGYILKINKKGSEFVSKNTGLPECDHNVHFNKDLTEILTIDVNSGESVIYNGKNIIRLGKPVTVLDVYYNEESSMIKYKKTQYGISTIYDTNSFKDMFYSCDAPSYISSGSISEIYTMGNSYNLKNIYSDNSGSMDYEYIGTKGDLLIKDYSLQKYYVFGKNGNLKKQYDNLYTLTDSFLTAVTNIVGVTKGNYIFYLDYENDLWCMKNNKKEKIWDSDTEYIYSTSYNYKTNTVYFITGNNNKLYYFKGGDDESTLLKECSSSGENINVERFKGMMIVSLGKSTETGFNHDVYIIEEDNSMRFLFSAKEEYIYTYDNEY